MLRRFMWGISVAILLGSSLAVVGAAPATAASPRCFSYNQAQVPPRLGWPDQVRYIFYPVENNQTNNWRCAMSRGGSQGWYPVSYLQEAIDFCYHHTGRISLNYSLNIDGVFGSLTREALIKVQQYHRISADGIYGPQTAGTIYHVVYIYYSNGSWARTCSTLAAASIS